jgi:hypothetical protein
MSMSIGSQVALAGSTSPTTSPGASRAARTIPGKAVTASRVVAAAGRGAANATLAAPAAKPTSARRDTMGGNDRDTTPHYMQTARAAGPLAIGRGAWQRPCVS